MSKKRVLYIEDNPHNKRLVRKLLTVKGYDVLEADDGLIGVEMAKRERPDLILMDINIPGIDGMEATARLKKSEVAQIPIVALTANAMVGDRERIMAAGCDEYMQKPVSNAVLWETVERFIGKGDTSPQSAPASASTVLPAHSYGTQTLRHVGPAHPTPSPVNVPALTSQPPPTATPPVQLPVTPPVQASTPGA
jgi:CheY-like chemotaxis protein